MDVLLHNHGSKRVFPIPEGLKELTSDIIREVLRHQPECIHTFIAEYLETMVIVREKARDSAVVVSNILQQGYFFDDLYKMKNVKREEAEAYATVLQAGWRGYIVRKKFRIYLQKKRKLIEERERKKTTQIEQYLDSIGITYDEATRAACIIQAAYRQSCRGKWIINDLGEEVWMEGEDIPVGQRIREADISRGRYDRWEKKDWGDFFEMDDEGEIQYDWPKVGQLFKIPRDFLTPDMEIVRFYGMRDLEGKEQYTYLKGPQKGINPRGFPIGFLIPLSRELLQEDSAEIIFLKNENNERMGKYTFVYEKAVEKQDLNHFANVLSEKIKIGNFTEDIKEEEEEEFDYNPDWVLPRILIQIRKDCIRETDDEIAFKTEAFKPEIDEFYTFRAEKPDLSLKVINRILNNDCTNMEEAMTEASNIPIYKQVMVGRFLAVDMLQIPKYIQKVVIQKETKKAEYENREMDMFEYVFLSRKFKWPKNKVMNIENPIEIPISRFQGYRNNYRASAGLNKQTIFVMGPMLCSPDGEPFNYSSIFWDCFGLESWYQLLCNIANRKIAQLEKLGEAAEDVEEEHEEATDELEEEVKEKEVLEEEKDDEREDKKEEEDLFKAKEIKAAEIIVEDQIEEEPQEIQQSAAKMEDEEDEVPVNDEAKESEEEGRPQPEMEAETQESESSIE